MNIIANILANAAAIFAASRLVSGFSFRGDWLDLLLAGAVLGVVNSFVRPIVKLLSLPIIFVTLGLFTVVINFAMIFLVDHLLSSISIHGFWAAFWGIIVISFVNHLVLSIFNHSKEN